MNISRMTWTACTIGLGISPIDAECPHRKVFHNECWMFKSSIKGICHGDGKDYLER